MKSTEPTNFQRQIWAHDALTQLKRSMGESGEVADDDLVDLLADLRHWAHARGFDMNHALVKSAIRYNAERIGD